MTRREQIVSSLRLKEYRDEYVAARVGIGLPSQIRQMRKVRGWNQTDLAKRAGMHQSQISDFERSGCESFTANSLLRLASAFDVGLKVRLVAFSELVQEDANPELYEVNVPSFGQDILLRQDHLANMELGSWIMQHSQPPSQAVGGSVVGVTVNMIPTERLTERSAFQKPAESNA
jgi:transcriptional regulator with XRE-family HTH domain